MLLQSGDTVKGVKALVDAGKAAKTGWDDREVVTEGAGKNITMGQKKYEFLGYDKNGSPVYQDAEVLKEQSKQSEEKSKQADDGKPTEGEDVQNEVENSEKNGTMKISGARITDQYGDDADNHAERYYGLVRSMKTDVAKIAKVSGFTESDIQNVKNYIFYEVHDLGEGEPRRFYSSFAMSQSWQRLMEGHSEKHDITMLQHELLERELVEKGMSQEEAHIIASKEYNYAKESEEYYGALKEHKNRG